jgi:hypothetical protein
MAEYPGMPLGSISIYPVSIPPSCIPQVEGPTINDSRDRTGLPSCSKTAASSHTKDGAEMICCFVRFVARQAGSKSLKKNNEAIENKAGTFKSFCFMKGKFSPLSGV